MKVVIFGPVVGTPSPDPHAPMWRALIRALHGMGHRVVFFQRAAADSGGIQGGELVPYPDWRWARPQAAKHLADSDAAIVASSCVDAAEASQIVLESPARVRCFYDLNPAATLGLPGSRGEPQSIPPGGLGAFDLVLSYTGGRALAGLKTQLGAKHVAPLYGCVDPDVYQRTPPDERYRADLSYLGEWLPELDAALEGLFLEPARRRPDLRFVVGGSDRPDGLDAGPNVTFVPQVPHEEHPSFYSSSSLTLNVTSGAAADMGYCPSARIFESAACGVPVLTDDWEGLDYFFEPSREILVAHTTGHVMDALAMAPDRLAQLGRAARERVLSAHTGARRALELEHILHAAISLPVEHSRARHE